MKKGQFRKSGGRIKDKRAVLSFIAAFVCCTVVFGAAAAILMLSTTAVFHVSSGCSGSSSRASYPASNTFNMLFCVYSDSGVPVEFMLYRLDTVKNKTVVMAVPLEIAVTSRNSVCSLADEYKSGGISDAANALSALLSVKIDYTCSIGSGNFLKLCSVFGGLYGAVPENINVTMPDGGGRIALAASPRQYLGGGKLYALIACPSYSGGNKARYGEQSALMKEFVAEKLTGYYLKNVNTYFGSAFNYVSTDFSMNELLKRTDAMTALSAPEAVETPPPSYSPAGAGLLQFSNAAAVRKSFS